ncbi:PQQ-dependent sugar dehydrogenase [Deltaproteobacteria bacterium TL4]
MSYPKLKKFILIGFTFVLAVILLTKFGVYILRLDPTEAVDAQKGIYFKGCIAETPESLSSILSVEPIFTKLSFDLPIGMRQVPNDSSHWYVIEQAGRVQKFENQEDVSTKLEWANITDKVSDPHKNWEHGFLGLAFDPNYQHNAKIYLYYITPSETSQSKTKAVLSSFTVNPKLSIIDGASEQPLLTLDRNGIFHHGGTLHFGPDGFLYLGLGDGNGGGDDLRPEVAQDINDLNGSILRMDVTTHPYRIPKDNPFAQGGGAPEIFAWGFRNPWGWSFDRQTGELWVGDVGANLWEEINRVSKGENYGWPLFEGPKCFQKHNPFCLSRGLNFPLVAHHHQGSEGMLSITGGFVYRGKKIPELQGLYLYAGFLKGTIYGLSLDPKGPRMQRLLMTPLKITAFSEDQEGEIYLINYEGNLHKIVPSLHQNTPATLFSTCPHSENSSSF